MKLSLSLVAVLFLAANAWGQGAVSVKQAKEKLDFYVGDDLATSYLTAGYARPIFWPIKAPGNIPLTRAWPLDKSNPKEATDHPHQKSVWFCHGDVIPEGIELKHKIKGVEGVDFWSEAVGHGDIVCTFVGGPTNSKDAVHVKTRNEWRTADGVKIMDETRNISFHNLGKARLIILDIDLHASVCKITFGDTKEGSMGIRINEEITAAKNGNGKIQNAEGKVGEKECWGKVSAWCDYSGPVDGKVVGLALLSDPKNAYPACWHARGYGLMAANPFGRNKSGFPEMKGRTDLVRLAKGDHLHLRYGVLVHEGDAITGQVADSYQRFVELGKAK